GDGARYVAGPHPAQRDVVVPRIRLRVEPRCAGLPRIGFEPMISAFRPHVVCDHAGTPGAMAAPSRSQGGDPSSRGAAVRRSTPYRIRTDDLRLERAVSWATRRTGHRRLGAARRRADAAVANYTKGVARLRRAGS